MSDPYTTPPQTSARPTVAAPGYDPQPATYRPDPAVAPRRGDGGFSTGLLVAIVFVVVAIIAAAVFSNRDMFGIGLGVTPVTTPGESAVEPIAPAATEPAEPATPDPALAPAPVDAAPAEPAPAPAQPPATTNP